MRGLVVHSLLRILCLSIVYCILHCSIACVRKEQKHIRVITQNTIAKRGVTVWAYKDLERERERYIVGAGVERKRERERERARGGPVQRHW